MPKLSAKSIRKVMLDTDPREAKLEEIFVKAKKYADSSVVHSLEVSVDESGETRYSWMCADVNEKARQWFLEFYAKAISLIREDDFFKNISEDKVLN